MAWAITSSYTISLRSNILLYDRLGLSSLLRRVNVVKRTEIYSSNLNDGYRIWYLNNLLMDVTLAARSAAAMSLMRSICSGGDAHVSPVVHGDWLRDVTPHSGLRNQEMHTVPCLRLSRTSEYSYHRCCLAPASTSIRTAYFSPV